VEVKPLGPYELKGKRERIELFEIVKLKEGVEESGEE